MLQRLNSSLHRLARFSTAAGASSSSSSSSTAASGRPFQILLFPGQGMQHVGMGKDLADRFPTARRVFDEVDHELNMPLSKLMFNGPADELTLTQNAQPAVLAHSVASFRVAQELGLVDASSTVAALGHSVGEYSALCASGILSLSDSARLLRVRGSAMAEASPPGVGGMVALLGTTLADAEAIAKAAQAQLQESKPVDENGNPFLWVCQVSNINAVSQVVLSGHTEAIKLAAELAGESGKPWKRVRRRMPLQVSAPFHSSLMAPVQDKLRRELEQVDPTGKHATFPVISNVTAHEHGAVADKPLLDLYLDDGPSELKLDRAMIDLLVQHVTAPVKWASSMKHALRTATARGGSLEIWELGPGTVLTSLSNTALNSLGVDAAVTHRSLSSPKDLEAGESKENL